MNNSIIDANPIKIPWFTCFILLVVFALTSPWDFNFAATQASLLDLAKGAGYDFGGGGNRKRQAGMGILALYSLVLFTRSKNRYRVNQPLGWFLIFYFFWILLSLSWSIDQWFTVRRVIQTGILWFGALVFAGRYSIRQIASIAVFVCGTTLAIGVVNELRLHTFAPTNGGWRFAGVFHAITMGWNCGLLCISTMFLAINNEKKYERYFFWAVFFFSLILLYFTRSRMAVASTMISIGMYSLRVVAAEKRLLLILIFIIVGSLSYLVLGQEVVNMSETAATLGRGEAAKGHVSNLTGRIPLWKECFRWAYEKPLTGYGFNTFIGPHTLPSIKRNIGWIPGSTHNAYIDALVGLGFVGFSTMITFLILALKRSYDLSLIMPAYFYLIYILVWMCYNLLLESNLFTRPYFMAFFCMILITRLAFLPAKDLDPY